MDHVRPELVHTQRISPSMKYTIEVLLKEAKGQEDFWRGYRTGLQTILNMNNDLPDS